MSRRARQRRDKRAPWPSQEDDNQSSPHSTRFLGTRMDTGLMCLHTAQAKRRFCPVGQKIPMRIRVSFQRRPGAFILPLAGRKLKSDLVCALGFGNNIVSKRSRKLGPVTLSGNLTSGGSCGGAGQETGSGCTGFCVAQPAAKISGTSSKGSDFSIFGLLGLMGGGGQGLLFFARLGCRAGQGVRRVRALVRPGCALVRQRRHGAVRRPLGAVQAPGLHQQQAG